MKNYINLNGKNIKLTKEQVNEFTLALGLGQVQLKDIEIGDTFKIGEYEFIVLEHSKETTAVILKELYLDDIKFGTTNNYDGSNVDGICYDFGKKISKIIGDYNLIEHTVDLVADDGLKCYGTIKRQMSLITANLYRRYVEILDKHKLNAWWWTATAYSTPKHNNSSWVKCVSPSGNFYYYNYFNNFGVRPFCILNSNIFVSK